MQVHAQNWLFEICRISDCRGFILAELLRIWNYMVRSVATEFHFYSNQISLDLSLRKSKELLYLIIWASEVVWYIVAKERSLRVSKSMAPPTRCIKKRPCHGLYQCTFMPILLQIGPVALNATSCLHLPFPSEIFEWCKLCYLCTNSRWEFKLSSYDSHAFIQCYVNILML